jgi:hypothetical protein
LKDYAFLGLLPTPTNSMVTYQDFEQAKYHSSKRPSYSTLGLIGELSLLNPQYVLEMMGFPSDWTLLPFLTELNPDSQPLLTESGEQNPLKGPETP